MDKKIMAILQDTRKQNMRKFVLGIKKLIVCEFCLLPFSGREALRIHHNARRLEKMLSVFLRQSVYL